MSGKVFVHRVGPGVSPQDTGRPGWLGQGLSRGGAADPLALVEGAALLGKASTATAIEIGGSFLSVEVTDACRIALTGSPMRARQDGRDLAWNSSHALPAGAQLDLSGSLGGYSYLHFGGGLAMATILGAGSAHLAAGIGAGLQPGMTLSLADDPGGDTGMTLDPLPRFDGGILRVVETIHTALFSSAERERFTSTAFRKDARGNRMGQRLVPDGAGFGDQAGLTILSETIVPGDVQITGDGMPFVLLSECQTTGGYPRIATVLPCDLPRLVQAPAGAAIAFRFVTLDEAVSLELSETRRRAGLRSSLRPRTRSLHEVADLMSSQLISGVTRGDDLEGEGR